MLTINYKIIPCAIFLVLIAGCGISSGGMYSCSYESRHTGCGAKGWTDWEEKCENINMDNYREDWTPEKVCGKYSGSDTNCGESCCIYVEYRNTDISRGKCS